MTQSNQRKPQILPNTKYKRRYWLGHDTSSAQDRFFIEALNPEIWEKGTSEQWDTCWYTGMPDSETFTQLSEYKTINHIPGNNALTIKSLLDETLTAAKKHAIGTAAESRYTFFPQTFSMPDDYYRFQAVAASEPDTLWIQKPKNLSRGRGIEVVQHPEKIPFGAEWLIQRYIKNPHLYEGHKYVLRFYVLITSVEPLRCYLYEEGFAKLASEAYDETELDNLYRHLTNPDINEENDRVDVPVTFLSFSRYRDWLKSCGHDDQQLFDEFQDLITLTVIAARENLRHQLNQTEADTRGCYELIGLDCMVDEELKPWILECNLSPSLDTYASSDLEANDEYTVKRQLVFDLVEMMQLNEEIQDYSQAGKAAFEEQHQGGFIPLLNKDNFNEFLPCFPVPRACDVLQNNSTSLDTALLNTQAKGDAEIFFDDSLAIQVSNDKQNIHFLNPNELATWIWIKNSEGLSPQDIAASLVKLLPNPQELKPKQFQENLLNQVWDTLADWAQAGAFWQVNQSPMPATTTKQSDILWTQINQDYLSIETNCTVAANYLAPLFDSASPNKPSSLENRFVICQAKFGYTLLLGNLIVQENLSLAELFPALMTEYCQRLTEKIYFMGSAMTLNEQTILIVGKDLTAKRELIQQLVKHGALLNDYPYLGAKAGTLSCAQWPLIIDVNNDLSETCIAQIKESTVRLQKNHKPVKTLRLDGVFFIEKSEATNPLNAINKADGLSRLWHQVFKQNSSSAKALTQWLDETPLYSVDATDATAIDHLLATFSQSYPIAELS